MTLVYTFPARNLYGRQCGVLEYTVDEMLRCHRGFVKKSVDEIRRRGLVGDVRSDWHKQLKIARKSYRKYWKAKLKELRA